MADNREDQVGQRQRIEEVEEDMKGNDDLWGVSTEHNTTNQKLTYIPRRPQVLAAFECSSISSDIQRSPLAVRVDQSPTGVS